MSDTNMKMPQSTRYLCITLFLGLLARLLLSPYFSYYLDIDTYISWANYLGAHPLNQFYSNVWSDYLPGFHYILWLCALFQTNFLPNLTKIEMYQFYKLPAILSDIINGYLIYRISNNFLTTKKALFTTTIYLANIALFANSTFWGQTDSFMSLFILASLYFIIQKNLTLSGLFIGFGQVVKPITLLTIPFILVFNASLHSFKSKVYLTLYLLVAIFLTWLITFIPFNDKSLFTFIIERYQTSFNQYSFSSLNAFNFWGLVVGFWIPDKTTFLGLSYQLWGNLILLFNYLLIIAAFIYSLQHHPLSKKIFLLLFANGLAYFAMFLFLTRVHERHNMAALVCLSVVILAVNKKSILAIVVSFIIYLLNLLYAYAQLSYNVTIFDHQSIWVLSSLNIASYFYLLYFYLCQSLNSKT